MRKTVRLALALVLAACGSDASLDRTAATLERVRGQTELDDDVAARVARAAPGQTLAVDEAGLARLALDTGAQLLLDGGGQLRLVDESTVELLGGRAYAEAEASEELHLTHGEATVRASDAAISARVDDGLSVYVVRGEVSWTVGEARGVARSGERLTLSGDDGATEPVTLWHDWTGGLAQPGPGDARGSRGVGALEARVPDEVGQARWPLVMRRLDVQVRIVDDLAITEVEQVFFNPASEMVEGLYRVRVPEEAVMQRFAVDRDGRLVDGFVKEKAQARAQYEAQVYRGSQLDPALLEWVAPGHYQARIYPIRPGETRRIVIRYAEWLSPVEEGGRRLYRYPMGGGRDAPRIQELSIAVDVEDAGVQNLRAGLGAAIEEGRVRLRRSDFAPRSDFWLELDGGAAGQRAWRAPHEPPPRAPDSRAIVGEADERDYWYLPLRLPESLFEDARAEGLDLVVVADVSAGTDRAHLELGRSVTEALVAHLGDEDRVAIVASDLTIRPLAEDQGLGEPSEERLERLLDGLARAPGGGATDLGAALSAAAGLLEEDRPAAIVYVGDGAPTVGELEAEGLLERMARLPRPVRLYAIGVGSDANLALLETLTRGGGLAQRVEERSAAADAALRVLGHAVRPVAQRVTVELGAGIENVYPRRPVDVVAAEVLPVVGRVREEPPTEVVVRGTIGGEEFEETIAINTMPTEQSTDLRLRWAGERLRQLLLAGAGREEVAELGTRYGLITPFTSYYVPSAQELTQMGAAALPWMDRPDLFTETDRERVTVAEGTAAIVLAPLTIAGCMFSGGDEEPAAVGALEEEAPEWLEEAAADDEGGSGRRFRGEEGAMGDSTAERTNNRYGIQGPEDNAAPQMAREQAREATAAFATPTEMAEAEIAADEPAPPPAAQPVTATPEPEPDVAAAPLAGLDGIGGEAPRPSSGAARGASTIAPFGGATGYGRGGGGSGGGGDLDAFNQEVGGSEEPRIVERSIGRSRRRRRSGSRGPGQARPNRVDANDRTGRDEDAVARDLQRALNQLGYSNNEAADTRTGTVTEDASTVVRVVTTQLPSQQSAHHRRRTCSDAARASLSDRRALWRERLQAQSYAGGWVDVYRQAIRDCEAPMWRDRRALLGLILQRAGSVQAMIGVYRLFSSGGARGYLHGAILRRVRSPEDLRRVRLAFGLGAQPDWELIEQVLERANGDTAKVRALRRLTVQYPHSFDLKLRLLELLETSGRAEEARRLADVLRNDPRADAGVRTAIGEMYLRMDREEDARRVFSEIVEFAPLDELARRRLGDLYRAHGWFEDAYRQYETLISIRPDDPSALLLLAQAAAGSGRIDEALRLEQRLMETAQPGAERGVARIAQLWTSVRLAKLRAAADGDEDRLDALDRRRRRSGVLSNAGDLRVTLTWSHPDAQVALFAAHPETALARPLEIAPEYGIEAFDEPEQESGAYRFEVRRADPDSPTAVQAQLIVVWKEGTDEERVEIVDLDFSEGRAAYEWTLDGTTLSEG